MSRTNHNRKRNLAARMGRWSAAHWKTATFGWLAFVVVAFALGGMVGTKTIDPNEPGPGESGRMDRILDAGFKQPAGESVLIQSRSLRVGDPAFDAAIEDVVARVSQLADVQNVRSPLARQRGQIAKDGHAALVEFDIRGDKDEGGRQDRAGPRRRRRRAGAPTPASSSASSATPAREGGRRRRTGTTWGRPACSRSRSR